MSARAERRLAAIFAADVVGYSRLIEGDEEGTLAALKSHLRELIEPKVTEHRGRIVKTMGDGVLGEFASAVDAVRCAMDVQRDMATRNASAVKKIEFRIGVNVGDIVIDDGDIYGDGVNIAARIEGLAQPGGICVSGAVYDHVQGRVEAGFEDIGPQTVKNISRPIQVLRVKEKKSTAAAVTDVSMPVPGFQGRPAIAVLPLQNMSGDPEQEYFADGIAEDILTRLAMWRWCPIIARNSSFAYKGKSVDVRQIGKELGARYVLEGSVRKASDRVRIASQLIEAETGHNVWADRYERKLDDIFALQDDITDAITGALEPAVGRAEGERVRLKPPTTLGAWEWYQRGMWYWYRTTKDDFKAAREAFDRTAALDPNFASAHAMLAVLSWQEVLFAWTGDPGEVLKRAYGEAQTALGLDSLEPFTHIALCGFHMFSGQHDPMIAAGRRGAEINPSFALGHYVYGMALTMDGQLQDAVARIHHAMRLSPADPYLPIFHAGLGMAYYTANDYAKAVANTTIAVQSMPFNPPGLRTHAASLAQLGRIDDARVTLARFLQLTPGFSAEVAQRAVPFRNREHVEHYIEGLRKAGWEG